MTLACEDTNSKLVDIVTVANVDYEPKYFFSLTSHTIPMGTSSHSNCNIPHVITRSPNIFSLIIDVLHPTYGHWEYDGAVVFRRNAIQGLQVTELKLMIFY